MYDIIIAVLIFPNDPTRNKIAHQMFVAEQTNSYIDLYSVSSILGKERRVYGKEKDNYITIINPENEKNGFKVPSFIDCTKRYRVSIGKKCALQQLSHRMISDELRKRIKHCIEEKESEGKLKVYNISESEFRQWNPKIE